MANDNQTALQQSIQRKKDRLKEIDHGKHTPYANQLEVQFLQEQMAEDEKLLPTDRKQGDILIWEALRRAKEMTKVIRDYSKQPNNAPGTSNFDVCQAEKELAGKFVKMIESVCNEHNPTPEEVEFSYWLMEHCTIEEDQSLWSYEGEDYTNEGLYKIYLNEKYGSDE